MDWQLFNGILSTVVALALIKVVLSPKINEGPIIKFGLISMIFSLGGAAAHMLTKSHDYEALARSFGSLVGGLCLVLTGAFLRTRRGKRRMRDILGIEHEPT